MAHPHKAESDRHKDARVHKIAGKGAVTGVIESKVRKAITEHDKQLHGGARTHLKFAAGGSVPGMMPKPRMDKPSRKGKKGGNTVNVIVASHGAPPPSAPMMPPMPAGGAMAPMARPPMPPMAGPGPSMLPPPGAMPMRKKGGAVKGFYTGGAATGVGREEKVETYGKKAKMIAPQNRANGGALGADSVTNATPYSSERATKTTERSSRKA